MEKIGNWGKEMEEEEEEEEEVRFTQGQDVEIGGNETGFMGSWYEATVLHSSTTPSRSASKITKKVYVQYQTLMKDEKGSNPLTEYVNISRVRPQPPPPDEELENGSFEKDEEIEVFYNDGWWEGTIMQVLGNQKYGVFFRDSNEEMEFHQSEIRRRRNWINGRWVLAEKVEEVPVTLAPQNQSRIRSSRVTQSSQAHRKVSSSKKRKMQSSFNSETGFSRPCKTLKTAERMKSLSSLMSCSVREMSSSGKSMEVDGRNDFITSITKGKRTRVSRKRQCFRGLTAMFLDLSSEECNKGHPKPSDSYLKKSNDALERNGSSYHSSVQICSSQLPLMTMEVPQYKLCDHPKTKVPVQTTTKGSGTKAAVKGGKHKGAQGRSQDPAAHTQTHIIGPQQTTPSKETTTVVYREDTSKETEKDGASDESSELHQPLTVLLRGSCLQRPKKFKVRPSKQDRKPLGGDIVKLHTMKKRSNQTIDICNRRRQTTAKDSSTETAVNGGKHKSSRGRSEAPAAQTQTQIIGLEQTTPSKETTIVVHRGNTSKETEKDGASSDMSRLLQESCLPPIIGEEGVSSDNQLQKSPNVVESSPGLEHTTADTELEVAVRDEHNDTHLSWPFVKCSPLWELVESMEVFRSMPQKPHFHPLEEYNINFREGLALGCWLTFSSLVENMRKSQIEDPLSQLQSWSEALDDLEGHGFNVQPVRARLEKLTTLKVKYEDCLSKMKPAEEKIKVLNAEKEQLTTRLDEMEKEIREQAEIISQFKKKMELITIEKERSDYVMGELTTKRHQIREGIDGCELNFDQNVAAPW